MQTIQSKLDKNKEFEKLFKLLLGSKELKDQKILTFRRISLHLRDPLIYEKYYINIDLFRD